MASRLDEHSCVVNELLESLASLRSVADDDRKRVSVPVSPVACDSDDSLSQLVTSISSGSSGTYLVVSAVPKFKSRRCFACDAPDRGNRSTQRRVSGVLVGTARSLFV